MELLDQRARLSFGSSPPVAVRVQIEASTIDVVSDNAANEPITRTFSQTISLRNTG